MSEKGAHFAYAWVQCPTGTTSGARPCSAVFAEVGLMAVPGMAFFKQTGDGGNEFVRLTLMMRSVEIASLLRLVARRLATPVAPMTSAAISAAHEVLDSRMLATVC